MCGLLNTLGAMDKVLDKPRPSMRPHTTVITIPEKVFDAVIKQKLKKSKAKASSVKRSQESLGASERSTSSGQRSTVITIPQEALQNAQEQLKQVDAKELSSKNQRSLRPRSMKRPANGVKEGLKTSSSSSQDTRKRKINGVSADEAVRAETLSSLSSLVQNNSDSIGAANAASSTATVPSLKRLLLSRHYKDEADKAVDVQSSDRQGLPNTVAAVQLTEQTQPDQQASDLFSEPDATVAKKSSSKTSKDAQKKRSYAAVSASYKENTKEEVTQASRKLIDLMSKSKNPTLGSVQTVFDSDETSLQLKPVLLQTKDAQGFLLPKQLSITPAQVAIPNRPALTLKNKDPKIGHGYTGAHLISNEVWQFNKRLITMCTSPSTVVLADAIKLLNDGAQVDASDDTLTSRALHLAIGSKHKSLVNLLIMRGADVKARDASGNTPLHIAASSGVMEIVRGLIASVAINDRNDMNQTPLHLAAQNLCYEAFDELLDHGADSMLVDDRGKTALEYVGDPAQRASFAKLIEKYTNVPLLTFDNSANNETFFKSRKSVK